MHHRQIHHEQYDGDGDERHDSDDGQSSHALSFSGFSMATSFIDPVMLIDDAMFVLTVPES